MLGTADFTISSTPARLGAGLEPANCCFEEVTLLYTSHKITHTEKRRSGCYLFLLYQTELSPDESGEQDLNLEVSRYCASI